MGKAIWQPKWWSKEKHESEWERVKEALKRDWEQTKADLHIAGGKNVHQNVGDTVKQMAGKENVQGQSPRIPGQWDEVETPLMYGWGARQQYGKQHTGWNDRLEGTLKTEWEDARRTTGKSWDEVRDYVRRGYEKSGTT